MRTVPALLVLCLTAAAAVAGCSGSSNDSAAPTASPEIAAATEAVTPGTVVAPAIQSQPGLTTPQIVAKLAPSIVRVQTSTATLDIFGRTVPSTGVGTGVIIDTEGHIVTNNHVVTNDTGTTPADKITVTLSDLTTLPATIVGRDQPTDLAVIKVDATGLVPATFASPDSLVVGQDVVAMGFALDLKGGPTVTRGVLSAKGREINEQQYTINDAIQTDAGINPGNSGGALVNARGEVIGINTAIIRSAQNIGFAISVGLVEPTVKSLIETGKIDRAYLGVGTVDVTPSIARNFSLPVDHGIAVTVVGRGAPAEAAGLQVNDVIVKVDGQDVPNNGKLLAILANHRAGDIVKVEFYSDGQLRTADVTLASRPSG